MSRQPVCNLYYYYYYHHYYSWLLFIPAWACFIWSLLIVPSPVIIFVWKLF